MTVSKPNSKRRTYRQTINAAPDAVFPLMCPVRELEWTRGWAPIKVWSHSGLVEKDCVFTTPAGENATVWYVTKHDPDNWELEMIMVTPGRTASKLELSLVPDGPDRTIVEFAYGHTSLGPAGDAYLETFTEESYEAMMRLWEAELNYYLKHGQMLPPTEAAPEGITS